VLITLGPPSGNNANGFLSQRKDYNEDNVINEANR